MKTVFLFLVLFAIGAAPSARAQDRLFNKVAVDFPNPIHVNGQTVPAGHYEFRQLHAASGASRIVLVTHDGATRLETAVVPIPAVNNNTPDKTQMVIGRVGADFYLEKLWIEGEDYGYEFTIPDDVKSRMEEFQSDQPVRLWLMHRNQR